MFSQASVILSREGMHGGGGGRLACVAKGGGAAWQVACVAGGAHAWQETATAADGTHPTGMYSCFLK